jgi:hypothetical protein
MERYQEQIKLIEEMISSTKVNISAGSVYYLLWGWLVVAAAALNYYLLVYAAYEQHWIAWPILMPLGGIASSIIKRRQEKKTQVKTYVDRALNYLWTGFLITLFFALFGMVTFGPEGVYPMVMFLYGLGTFVSGGILKFKPLLIGAFGAWLAGGVAYFVPFQDQLLLLMASIILSYIIPGYLLAKSKANV